MSKPKVSYTDLELAFSSPISHYQSWLDKQTGEVIGYDTHIEDELLTGGDLSGLPKWQLDEVENARRVLRALGDLPGEEGSEAVEPDRYVTIPQIETRDAYETMVDFVETVRSHHLRELLSVAIRGSGAFRRFKDVLLDYPAERERWFEFESQREREAIEEWAREQGVEIDR
jgi:hypothetical protein